MSHSQLSADPQSAPQPIRTGGTNNVLRCPMTGCPFYCRAYVSFEGHLESRHYCMDCAKYSQDLESHTCEMTGQRLGHVDASSKLDLTSFYEFSRSHGGSMVSYKYKHDIDTPDVETAFIKVDSPITKLLKELYEIHTLSKIEISLGILMEKEVVKEDGTMGHKQALIYFKSNHHELQTAGAIKNILLQSASDIVEKKSTFLRNGSGWYIVRIESVEVKIGEIRLFGNSRASGYLPMPLKSHQGYVNFKNKDDDCFKYCVAAGIHWQEQVRENKLNGANNKNLACHETWKKYLDRFNFKSIRKTVNIYNDLPAFEEDNDVSVNILSHKKGDVVMVRSSKTRSANVVNMFLIHKKVKRKILYHLVLITNLNKFLGHKKAHGVNFCQTCFRNFGNQKRYVEHIATCRSTEDSILEKWPKEGEKLKFQRPELTLSYPYVCFYDFECFSEPQHGATNNSATTINHEFKPASYSLCIVENMEGNSKVIVLEYYDGEDPVNHFFKRVFKHSQDLLFKIRTTNNFVVPTRAERERHKNATHCDFCKREFTSRKESEDLDSSEEDLGVDETGSLNDWPRRKIEEDAEKRANKKKNVTKCFHHCHQNGKYQFTLCGGCNLKVKFKHEMVFIAHNNAGFDLHLLIKNMNNSIFNPSDISVISKGTEKFVQMVIPAREMYVPSLNSEYNRGHENHSGLVGNRKVKIRLIDSYQFLPSSLSSLASALKKENVDSLNLIKQSLPFILNEVVRTSENKRLKSEIPDESLNLLFEKLPFPYTYLSSAAVLQDGHEIPSREHFNNDLRKEVCTDEEWDLVQRVCASFRIKDFRQFTRLYTIVDTILLAVIWENFRKNGISMYGLDPTYMCTGSGYSFQCFLYKTGTELEYVRDKKMLDLITSAVRGGTSFCTRKIQTANNERYPLGYDSNKLRTHIIYNDVVSLYATALLDKYPYSDYKWEDKSDMEKIDWSTYDGDEDRGYFLQVTLGYPPKVQDETVDQPLAPERRTVRLEELSERQQNTLNKLDASVKRSFTTYPRLLLHNFDRVCYTLHYKTLRYYLKMGMTLKAIHTGISFTEKSYFREYIQFNIDKRKEAKSESMRQFLKNQNNQIFGKCLQSNKNNLQIKFCTSRAQSRNLLSKPECKDFLPISENLSIVLLRPKHITLNKPIWAGAACLDLAKVIFYTGYYQKLKKIFGNRIYNLYCDTHSSVSIVEDPNNCFWNDLVTHGDYFDFSKIPANHDFFQKYSYLPDLRLGNAGESGKWKVESLDISEIVTLKSKQYSILYHSNAEEMKCKGIPSSSLKSFSHQKYKNVVLDDSIVNMKVNYIRSINHSLYNITVDKIGFHNLDISRIYSDPEDINFSLPLGHYKLPEIRVLQLYVRNKTTQRID